MRLRTHGHADAHSYDSSDRSCCIPPERFAEGIGTIPPAPIGKNIWGTVTLADRGQIVIPKAARDHLSMKGGCRLIVLSDETGIALVPAESFETKMRDLMDALHDR